MPPSKPAAMPIAFLLPGSSVVAMGQAVFAAISAGDVPSDPGVRQLPALADPVRRVEVEALEPRSAALVAARRHAYCWTHSAGAGRTGRDTAERNG